ncbi:MAG TPA: ABC transporter permease [Spirochaetales bacterium]|nr:ABC transporter permease [Spirochaetales bacterium]
MNTFESSIPLIHNSVNIMTPFLLAAMGGLFTELSGMLNIALEGLMLFGAFFSVVFAYYTGSLFFGVLLGITVTMALSLVFGSITLYLKANVFITGLATNLFASGFTVVLAFHLFGNKGVILFQDLPELPKLTIPLLQKLPFIGDLFINHNIFVYLSWLVVIAAYLVIYKTPFGMHVRGTGLNARAIKSLGLNPRKYQLSAILISGFTCGLAGAVLTLNLGAFIPNMTSGRGWIALVVIYLGNRTPLGVLIASFIFGFAESFSNYAQGSINIPADFILAFPYLITVAALILHSMWKHYRVEAR